MFLKLDVRLSRLSSDKLIATRNVVTNKIIRSTSILAAYIAKPTQLVTNA